MDLKQRATEILKDTYGKLAEFKTGQLEAIISVLEKKKTLVVQKTGWGKSVVYFIATKILREKGAGPSIIISPLLALMKNQIESAQKLGINLVTINSDNKEYWDEIYEELPNSDAIIISPERLSNEEFMEELSKVNDIKLFVVDEAHCISDWGHDFRPDYQRIVNLLNHLPHDIAILGTTATANDTVIDDIKTQLGDDILVVRGDLIRKNLAIQVNPTQSREERLAFLLQNLSNDETLKSGQGIIYCLTQRECEMVSGFLSQNGINAASYHSGLEKDVSNKVLEDFDCGNLRVIVCTIKLGMGYDKSDVRFVIHFQLPKNLVSYYQQIGRAGRDGKKAYAILLHGNEDTEILDYFIESAQVHPEFIDKILNKLTYGAKEPEMLKLVNLKPSKVKELLKYLQVHDYVYKEKAVYSLNTSKKFDASKESEKQERLNKTRKNEFNKLMEYLDSNQCYMKFIADELDAPDKEEKCGVCANCIKDELLDTKINKSYMDLATNFLKNKHGKIKHRKKWANYKNISQDEKMEDGWVLTEEYYSQIGQLVKNGKYIDNEFSKELVDMSENFLKDKVKNNLINLVVPVPSLRKPDLVPNFAKSLAECMQIPYKNIVKKIDLAQEQKSLNNSALQEENIRNSTEIEQIDISDKIILLVDDMVDSRWTFTVIAAKLLEKGAKAVYPYALVKTGSGD